ncbi:MAG TPA: NUDIX hydrolase, partial [Vicinamibacterales bacterium]|nr:NUDIX hydrolase [Vicinamibacterales bacterium]
MPARPKRLSRSTPFHGRVFHVDRDRVRLSNGRTATLDIVRHRGSVVLIPQPSAREVILIRQFRYAIGQWVWELPAGTLDPGERPAAAARRECAEEIGLWPKRIEKLGAFYPTPGFCDEIMIYYRCRDLVTPARPVHLDPDEQITPKSFPIARARALIARGDIV